MKKIFLLLILIFISNISYADFVIEKFDEHIKFTEKGREVDVVIKARVKLGQNYFYKEWGYIFDKRSKINIVNAKVVGKSQYKTSFGNNTLKFQFDKAINGDVLEFRFKYNQETDDISLYSRSEHVSIPAFASNARGSIKVEIPYNYITYSLNPQFTLYGNTYSWSGKVPNDGFSDFFNLTLKQARWNVRIISKVYGDENISKIDLKIPSYFKNGNNIIEKYSIIPSQSTAKIKEYDNDINIFFDKVNSSSIVVTLDAVLRNDVDNKSWIRLDPTKYLNIDPVLSTELQNLIYSIKANQQNKPLYITLAEWVHNFIQYNDTYFGKDMTTQQILSLGKGVCIHYAQLYNDLLRASGIPSIIVAGESYDIEKKRFESHAWNLIHVNGDWISIDPTWGIYSGKLPVSHIFFYLTERPVINYTIYNTSSNNFRSEVNKSVEFLN